MIVKIDFSFQNIFSECQYQNKNFIKKDKSILMFYSCTSKQTIQ